MFYLSKTPLRISLFGGGTDYPEYFHKNKGAVLGFAINKYIYCFASEMHDSVNSKFRISYKDMEEVKKAKDINHPIIRTLLKNNSFFKKNKWHFGTLADVPAGTGLGSSSAFTVCFLNLLEKIQNNKKSKLYYAKQAFFVEKEILKENVGIQDSLHSSFGGINIFKFSKKNINVESIDINKEKIRLLNSSMILCYIGNPRNTSDIVTKQIKGTIDGSNDHILDRMYDSVFKAKEILNKEHGSQMLKSIGKLLNENWEYKKNLSSNISNKKIDSIISEGLRYGAYGCKLCGAGKGGFLFFIVNQKSKNLIKMKLNKINPCMDIKIDFHGVN